MIEVMFKDGLIQLFDADKGDLDTKTRILELFKDGEGFAQVNWNEVYYCRRLEKRRGFEE